jgi:hypothetical protein
MVLNPWMPLEKATLHASLTTPGTVHHRFLFGHCKFIIRRNVPIALDSYVMRFFNSQNRA